MNMDLLEKIFTILDFNTEQKRQARADFDVLVRARTIEQLLVELPEEKKKTADAHSAADVLATYYSSERIKEYTIENMRQVLKEYVDFLLESENEYEQKEIMRALQETAGS